MNLVKDIEEVKKLVKTPVKNIHIFVAPEWKFRICKMAEKGADVKEIMKNEEFKKHGKDAAAFCQKITGKKKTLQLGKKDEMCVLKEAKEFLKKETGLKVEIEDAEASKLPKAASAEPMKPGIYAV